MLNSENLTGTAPSCKLSVKNLNVFHHDKQVLFDVTLPIEAHTTTALIGPSGCGKSTFLRALNRMNELVEGMRMEGHVFFDQKDIYASDIDVVYLRSKIGMVFQKPCPFPMTIYDNVAYGPRIHALTRTRDHLDEIVHDSLKKAGLWEEVRDRLFESARKLSGGQQQRLCIARAIAVNPEVILMDEPTSALDPLATARIEELIDELRKRLTIVLVTHNLQQAARISQNIGFFIRGSLVEYGDTEGFFTRPQDARTQAYLTRSR